MERDSSVLVHSPIYSANMFDVLLEDHRNIIKHLHLKLSMVMICRCSLIEPLDVVEARQ